MKSDFMIKQNESLDWRSFIQPTKQSFPCCFKLRNHPVSLKRLQEHKARDGHFFYKMIEITERLAKKDTFFIAKSLFVCQKHRRPIFDRLSPPLKVNAWSDSIRNWNHIIAVVKSMKVKKKKKCIVAKREIIAMVFWFRLGELVTILRLSWMF